MAQDVERHPLQKAYTPELSKMIGWEITGFALDNSGLEHEHIFGIVIFRKGQKRVVWIAQDPEFNGPGHLEVQDMD
jgi:hypothetical protein